MFFIDPVNGLQLSIGRSSLPAFYCGRIQVDFAIPRDDASGCTAGRVPTQPVKQLRPNESDTLKLQVTFPESASNEFNGVTAGKQTTIKFVWTAIEQPVTP